MTDALAIFATAFVIGGLVLGTIELADKPNVIPLRSIILMEIGWTLFAIDTIIVICLHR